MIRTTELSPTPGMCLGSKELLIQLSSEGVKSVSNNSSQGEREKPTQSFPANLALGLFCTDHWIFAPEKQQEAVSSR